ncbi:centromere-associated protein E isoform X2 [Lepisosteus oculatus]|uniref:centromere-associated protein E isoform X2 n=1 Tax=Lepisosteus oculatus TaxID=7918 RepID=UPI0035F52A41
MAGESAVKVCVRVRPLIQREEAEVSNVESVPIYWKTDQQTVYQVDGPKTFSFDRVFNVNESTSQVYDEVAKPLVISAIKGYNGTIFAYGQTSSGKTFTMMGSNESLGVIPLAIHDIFETIAQSQNMEFLLRVSYMEIYNETVTDLLVDSTKRKPLEIREGINRTVYVADLTEEVVVSASQVLEWIKKGEKNRHYGDTKMNQRSSRSHTIFRMILESRERSDPSSGEIADQAVMVSHLNLVDLAGSERASQTGAEGLRLKEGCNINRSLFTLGQVIKKLTDGNGGGFTNYRDSKLTRILQNSLGGNAKTVIICTITPATVEETLSTLQFASTAKHMKNDPHVNEVLDDGALMRRYRNEIVDLKRRLEEVSSETRMQATEKEVLAQLLQEKDQLQKEQEDRIRNLTKIVITSSSFAINDVKIRSKRRMTWGGKLLRGRQSEGFHFGDIGFLEHATKRKKSDLSALIEPDDTLDIEGEDVWQHNIEDFPFDVEMNMSNVSVRRSKVVQSTVSDVSASTPNSLSSQIQLSEVKERIAGLEEELQKKIRETWEAVEKQNAAEKRVSELEEALKAQDPRGEGSHVEGCREALCKMYEKDFRDTIQLCETLVAEKEELSAKLNLLKEELDALWKEKEGLQQEKVRLQQEIIEKEEQHEFNILEQEVHKQSETELAKEITSLKMELENSGVCIQNLKAELEAKSNELQNKEEWIAELENMGGKDLTEQIRNLKHSLGDAEAVSRDTKKEWAFLRSENLTLKERENDMAARYKQMEVEVNQLRSQLESEKMRFKRMETDLQKELLMAFEENAKLNTLLDGKVPKNLIERLDLEKSVAELKKELEKSQEGERALQTEVNSLSALKNLPDKVDDLMKQVCDVSNELCATRVERDDLLSAKVERDEEIQRLTEAVQQVTEDLRETQTKLSEADQKMANLSEQHSAVQAQYVEVAEDCEKLKTELESSSIEKQQCLNGMEDLKLQVLNVSEELQLVNSERDSLLLEKRDSTQRTEADLQELRTHVASLTQEREQLQEILESVRAEKSQLKADLEEKMVETQEELRQQQQLISDLKTQRGERETQLEQQINDLSGELKLVSSDRDSLLSERRDSAHRPEEKLEEMRSHITSLTQEREQLQEILESVRAEKSQLKAELEEKMVETQEELRQQQQLISDLKTQSGERETQLEDQVNELSEKLKLVSCERDSLLSERRDSGHRPEEELEELRTHITSLTQEREQLQEILESVRAEKSQLKIDLEENVEMMIETQEELREAQEKIGLQKQMVEDLRMQLTQNESQMGKSGGENISSDMTALQDKVNELSEQLQLVSSERDSLLLEKRDSTQRTEADLQELRTHITSLTQEREQLQEILESVRAEKSQLQAELEEKMVETQEELRQQQQLISDLKTQRGERETQLEQQINDLSEELKLVSSERDSLLSERRDSAHRPEEELEELRTHITSLTQEREQLQEILESVRAEKSQLKAELEENVEMNVEAQSALHCAQEEIRQQQELISDLKTQSAESESDLEHKMRDVNEQLRLVSSERDSLLSERRDSAHRPEEELEELRTHIASLTQEKEQLQETLESVRAEKSQLQAELENVEAVKNQEELRQQQLMTDLKTESAEREAQLEQQLRDLNEQLRLVSSERDSLLSERRDSAHRPEAELEEMRSHITSLTQEREQLQETLESVRAEKSRLQAELEENVEMAVESQAELQKQQQLMADFRSQSAEQLTQLEQQLKELNERLKLVTSERDAFLSERTDSAQMSAVEVEELRRHIASLAEERDQLQEILESVRAEKQQLKADLEENVEMSVETQEELRQQQQLMTDLKIQTAEKEAWLQQQITELSEKLKLVSSERDSLPSERRDSGHRPEAELEEMRSHIASLTQEREQLQEILESVRAEKSQLKAELEEKMVETQEELRQQQQLISDLKTQREERETQLEQQVNELSEQLKLVSSESETLLSEKRDSTRRTEAELEELRTHITSLTQEREQLQETLESVRAEKSQLQAELEEKINKLNEELKLMSSQHDTLLSESRNSTRRTGAELEELRTHITSLTQEREQLQETLESVRAEKSQLKADLEENISVAVETQAELCRAQDELRTQQELISDLKTQRTKRETQLDLKVNELSEQLQLVNSERDSLLLEKRDSTQRTESDLQELRTHITSLTQEREQLQETLESVRAEKSQLNSLEDAVSKLQIELHQVQGELNKKEQEAEELKGLVADKEVQLNSMQESLSAKVSVFQQLVQGQERALEERDRSLAELQGKVAALAQERQQLQGSLEHLREQLESQTEKHQALIAEFELQSQASVSEDQRQSQRLKESEEQYQECLKRFQLQIDQFKSCAKNISALLNKDTTSQSKLVRQFVSSLPAEQSKSMLKLNSGISKINTDLVLRLRQQACVYSSIAEIHKDHFETALQHSIASFEERKLHDLLIQRIQRASGSSSEHVSQQAQRASDLLEERQRQVQEMTEILAELEDGLSCHATSRAQEHPIQEEINRTLKALCAAPTAGFVELEQVLQKENTRMTEKLQQTTQVLEGLKAKYYDIKERCQALLAKSTAELKEQRDRSQTLLVELDDGSPKKGSEVLQENLLLLERLEGSEKEIKTMQLKIKKLEGSLAGAEAKAADRKRAADGMQMELQKLVAQVKERDESISTLRRSLSELEKKAEKGASPYIEELETLRSKLVKMEMERTGLLKKQEQTVAAMTAALEHRDESLRKLKETLRKSQQDQEASFVADEKPHTKAPVTCGGGSGIVQSTMMLMIKAEKAKLEAEVHQQKKKIGQMESVVSSLQAEASKWKGRARKLKETSGLKGSLSEMETLCDNQPNVSPRTPTKRRQVTSEGFILDSPKSKFFDSRSGSLSVACPKQFFDNSTLGTIPDVNPTAEPNSEGDWWSLAPQKDGAENCKTQ